MTNHQAEPPAPDDRDIEHQAQRTPGNRRKRSGPTWRLLAALGVCVCATAAGVSLVAFSGPAIPSHGDAAHRDTASGGLAPTLQPTAATGEAAQKAPSFSGTTGPGITGEGIASTAMQWPRGLESRIQRWNAGPGGVALRAVTAQLGNAMQAAGVALYPEARQACVALGSGVHTALAAPPIPYTAMQRLYGKVLVGLSGAATDCLNAISVHPVGDEGTRIDLNKVLLQRSLAEFAAESKALYEATAEIRTLPGRGSRTRNQVCPQVPAHHGLSGETVYR